MIVDCHTHIWEAPEQLGSGSDAYLRRQTGRAHLTASPEEHHSAAQCADKTFVLGFVSRFLGSGIPNSLISSYVARHADTMIGLAGIDPTAPDALDELERTAADRSFRGVVISPASQDFHPSDSRVQRFYATCARRKLVVLVHQGTHFWHGAKMEFARPYLWDEVLRDHADLRLVVAHLGYPWVDETMVLLGKQPNAYADIAGLIRRPWHAYNALVQAHQYAVTDKLLFGSDFPFLSASEAIESLYRINEVTHGTMLPGVPREVLRGIIERNALQALGIEYPEDRATRPPRDADREPAPEAGEPQRQ